MRSIETFTCYALSMCYIIKYDKRNPYTWHHAHISINVNVPCGMSNEYCFSCQLYKQDWNRGQVVKWNIVHLWYDKLKYRGQENQKQLVEISGKRSFTICFSGQHVEWDAPSPHRWYFVGSFNNVVTIAFASFLTCCWRVVGYECSFMFRNSSNRCVGNSLVAFLWMTQARFVGRRFVVPIMYKAKTRW